ncbi:MAG: phosphatase PAP2 family protein [Opitutae bacterium]|nr:phosphatase PAP2 family protein [Opitutae bacterium]
MPRSPALLRRGAGLVLAALLAFAPLPALRAETMKTAAPPATRDFIAPDAIDWRALLTPPPAPDSIVARGEQELMRHLQEVRTPEQAKLAKYYEDLTIFRMLAPVLGDWCTAENLPRTAAVFRQAYAEARPAITGAKASWTRERPYTFDAAIQPVVDRPNNTSYPSGHSAEAALFAALLTELLPEHAADWQRQSALVRWSRIVGGAHYPSDVVAGQLLGEALAREMLKSPKLRQALEEVRAELAARRQKKAA